MDTKLKADIAESKIFGKDFDFAILYIDEGPVFYIMPEVVFNKYSSTITLVETKKRQRKPRAFEYRENWELLSEWAH